MWKVYFPSRWISSYVLIKHRITRSCSFIKYRFWLVRSNTSNKFIEGNRKTPVNIYRSFYYVYLYMHHHCYSRVYINIIDNKSHPIDIYSKFYLPADCSKAYAATYYSEFTSIFIGMKAFSNILSSFQIKLFTVTPFANRHFYYR